MWRRVSAEASSLLRQGKAVFFCNLMHWQNAIISGEGRVEKLNGLWDEYRWVASATIWHEAICANAPVLNTETEPCWSGGQCKVDKRGMDKRYFNTWTLIRWNSVKWRKTICWDYQHIMVELWKPYYCYFKAYTLKGKIHDRMVYTFIPFKLWS